MAGSYASVASKGALSFAWSLRLQGSVGIRGENREVKSDSHEMNVLVHETAISGAMIEKPRQEQAKTSKDFDEGQVTRRNRISRVPEEYTVSLRSQGRPHQGNIGQRIEDLVRPPSCEMGTSLTDLFLL